MQCKMTRTSQSGKFGLTSLGSFGLSLTRWYIICHVDTGGRNFTGRHLVDHQAQRIEIAAVVDLAPSTCSGDMYFGVPTERAASRHAHLRGFKRRGQPKVRNIDVIVVSDEDVVRLEIAMDDAFSVGSGKCLAKLARNFQAALKREGMVLL